MRKQANATAERQLWPKKAVGALFLGFCFLFELIGISILRLAQLDVGLKEVLGIALLLVAFVLWLFQKDFAQPARIGLFTHDPVQKKLHLSRWSVSVKALFWGGAMLILGFAIRVLGPVAAVALAAFFSAGMFVLAYAKADLSSVKPAWRAESLLMFLLLIPAAATGLIGLFNDQSFYLSVSMLACGMLGGFQLIKIRQTSAAGVEISGEQFASATLWMRLYLGAWVAAVTILTLTPYAREADRNFISVLEKSTEGIALLLLGGVLVQALGPGYASYRAILDKTPSHGSHKQQQSRLSSSRIRLGRTRRRAGSNRR